MMADPHSQRVSARAIEEDERARERGRVQMFNATRPDGLDGWTIALEQYELLVEVILGTIDASPPTTAQSPCSSSCRKRRRPSRGTLPSQAVV
ncbi:hypothetical protein RCH12_003475 [Cryobacterium sp. MP_3.1]|nr:hypothetical protein [Cryobacterium sp. MP_3.1]